MIDHLCMCVFLLERYTWKEEGKATTAYYLLMETWPLAGFLSVTKMEEYLLCIDLHFFSRMNDSEKNWIEEMTLVPWRLSDT